MYKRPNGLQLWRKRLVADSVAVALFNGANMSASAASFNFEDVGFTAVDRVSVRDLVQRRDLGVHVATLHLDEPIPPHGVVMFNLTAVWDANCTLMEPLPVPVTASQSLGL